MGTYLNMASKLPGMHGLGKFNKYANMMSSFSGGRRELDESEVSGVAGEQGFLGGEIGGAREFQDAESGASTAGGGAEAWQPIPPPPGYEMYGERGGGEYGGYDGSGPYQGGSSGAGYGGESQGYYRG